MEIMLPNSCLDVSISHDIFWELNTFAENLSHYLKASQNLFVWLGMDS